jgi:hypothetical protein
VGLTSCSTSCIDGHKWLHPHSPTASSSGRVARRCGFLEEGVLRGRLGIGDARRDALLYARLAADRSDA